MLSACSLTGLKHLRVGMAWILLIGLSPASRSLPGDSKHPTNICQLVEARKEIVFVSFVSF